MGSVHRIQDTEEAKADETRKGNKIEEKTDKGTTTTTSGTNRRKVISPKVRKQVIKYQGKQRYNGYN